MDVVVPVRIMTEYVASRYVGRGSAVRPCEPLAIVTCPFCGDTHAHTPHPEIKRAWCGRGSYRLVIPPP